MRCRRGLLIGLMLVGGCDDGFGPNEGLHSRVTIDRTRLVRGQEIEITVTVQGDVRRGILQGSSTCLLGYSVLDASGEIVAPGDVVCTADLITVGVPPDGLVRRFTWRGRSGLSEGGEPLPAGVYRIIGGPGPPGHVTGSVSGPVAIEIVEP